MNGLATFGDWLKQQREANGYSQGQLAEEVGVHRTYINQLENGQTWPKPETRAKYHAVFGTTDDDLVRAGVATRKVFRRSDGSELVRYVPVKRTKAPPSGESDALSSALRLIEDQLRRIGDSPASLRLAVNAVQSIVDSLLDTSLQPFAADDEEPPNESALSPQPPPVTKTG